MSQYPGGQQPPPNDPYYGQPPAGDPYAQQQGQDPYYGAPPPADPYAPPPDPYYAPPQGSQPPAQPGQYQQPWSPGVPPPPDRRQRRGGSGAAIFGIILVIIGVWVLFGDQLDIDVDWSEIWPIAFVVVGAVMVLAALIPGRGEREG
jgi:hypothetical protein